MEFVRPLARNDMIELGSIKLLGDSQQLFPQGQRQAIGIPTLLDSRTPYKGHLIGGGNNKGIHRLSHIGGKSLLIDGGSAASGEGGGGGEGKKPKIKLIQMFLSDMNRSMLMNVLNEKIDMNQLKLIFDEQIQEMVDTLIDKHRTFSWQELEAVNYRMLIRFVQRISSE